MVFADNEFSPKAVVGERWIHVMQLKRTGF
jgi:hypothetical protein